MAKYRIETNQGTFEIEADREPTAQDVEAYMAGGAPAPQQPTAPAMPAETPWDMMRERGGFGGGGSAKNKKAQMAAAATTARYGIPLLQPEGGPGGFATGGAGETVAQFIESGKVTDPGAVAASATMNAVPGAAAAKPFKALRNAARFTGGAVVAEEARSLINEGELVDPTSQAAIVAGTSLVAPAVGRITGKLTNNVLPEEAARVAQAMERNQPRDASLKAGQAIGMVVPPTAVNDTWLNRRLEGLAGGPRVGREAGVKNNIAGGDALRADIGLGKGAAMGDDTIDLLKSKAAEPYRRIAAMSENGGITMYHDGSNKGFLTTDANAMKAGARDSAQFKPKNPLVVEGDNLKMLEDREILDPDWRQKAFAAGHDAVIIDNGTGRIDAFIPDNYDPKAVIFKGTPIETTAADLEAMKQARNDAAGYYKRNVTNYDPNNLILAKAAQEKARALEERIRSAALQSGDSKLMKDFIEARTMYAKLDDIGRALNPDSGEINLNKIGKLSQKGEPLTGKLKAVGDFANAFEGKFTRPTASMPNPGASALEGPAMLFGGVIGGLKGAAVAASNVFLRDPIRNAILSKTGQKLLAQPNYVPRTVADQQVTNMTQRIAAIMALQMGSRVNPEKNPFMPPALPQQP